MRVRAAMIVSMCAAAVIGAGCTGLEPAALSAGASVAQTGVTIFDRGKVRTVERAKFDDVVAATRRAVEGLALRQADGDLSPGRMRLELDDERGETVVIVLERHTETITMIQADVGVLGEIGIASLVVKQIVAEMTTSGALPPPPEPPAEQTSESARPRETK